MDDLTSHVLQRFPQGESLKVIMLLHNLNDLTELATFLNLTPGELTRHLQDGTVPVRPPMLKLSASLH